MKLLVTGASGLYGSRLADLVVRKGYEVFSARSQHEVSVGVPVKIDITEKTQVQTAIDKIRPDVIVHAASLTDVDKCELNKELANKVNVEGTKYVVDAAKASGSFLLYISTDYVFDGERGCYRETDLPSPISYYAYTKLKAEEYLQDNMSEFCIARPSVIYGATPAAGKVNFALWLLNKFKNREEAKVFVDQRNSPTLNTSLAEMTLEVAERRLTGIYHLSGATRISRYDFAVKLAEMFGLDSSVLVPSYMRDLSFPAKRPKDSSLDTTKAAKTLKNKPLDVDEALARLKAELGSF